VNRERRRHPFRILAKNVLHAGFVGEAVRRIAAVRGRSLVLVYHRVSPSEVTAREVVPQVPPGLFRRQLEALADVGEIVSLEALLQDRGGHLRPRFAITFDDDYMTHVDHALPVLKTLDAPATFFLSGRALHGLGPYWFEVMEQLVNSRGVGEISHFLHMRSDGLEGLISACENDPALQRIIEAEGMDAHRQLDRPHIEALFNAGMAVGFHTLHHEVLTRLDNGELETALIAGRSELERVVGRPLSHFAYPHGKTDPRTAGKVRDAGFEAAWTGRPEPMHRRDDRYRLGRWEPGRLQVEDFLVSVAVRLTRGVHR
jgi:peptidoglycan/xylan/chitin deacetylase (PgdA/CDA1 family)